MFNETLSEAGEEPPSSFVLNSLKQFRSAAELLGQCRGSGLERLALAAQEPAPTLTQLQRLMPTLTPEEHAGTLLADTKLAMSITPYFFSLIDPADESVRSAGKSSSD